MNCSRKGLSGACGRGCGSLTVNGGDLPERTLSSLAVRRAPAPPCAFQGTPPRWSIPVWKACTHAAKGRVTPAALFPPPWTDAVVRRPWRSRRPARFFQASGRRSDAAFLRFWMKIRPCEPCYAETGCHQAGKLGQACFFREGKTVRRGDGRQCCGMRRKGRILLTLRKRFL